MFTEMARTARRFALTLAVSGIAVLGSVAIAPAASAGENGSASVVVKAGGNGPDEFLVFVHGKKPVFFCEDGNTRKQHNKCLDVTGPVRF